MVVVVVVRFKLGPQSDGDDSTDEADDRDVPLTVVNVLPTANGWEIDDGPPAPDAAAAAATTAATDGNAELPTAAAAFKVLYVSNKSAPYRFR